MDAPHPAQRTRGCLLTDAAGPPSARGRTQLAGPHDDAPELPPSEPPEAPRPWPLLARPWFWVALVALMFSVPLVKSLRMELPERLPGEDAAPLLLQLPDETGALFELASVRGRIVMLTGLPLASATAREQTFDGIRRLRKRLRGLADAVHYVVLCQGGDTSALSRLLDDRHARKPVTHYVLDPQGHELARLFDAAGAPSAAFLLLDRHGRVRGTYADTPRDIDRLVSQTGQLANWPGQDPAPGGTYAPGTADS